MILSASRRTDIPCLYVPWLMNRLRAGSVLVRNPMNHHQVSRVSLAADVIDCAVFWTKHGASLLPHLDEIETHWPFYFQYTLNGYGRALEPGLPALEARLDTLRQLSDRIGPARVIWRYDPVLMTDVYGVPWHLAMFERIAAALAGYVETCVFSFIDMYPKVQHRLASGNVRGCTLEEMHLLAAGFAESARRHGMGIQTCAEAIDLDQYGIAHGCCTDGRLIKRLVGQPVGGRKDPNQRAVCGCLESIDIGQYNTCPLGCLYCYASFNPKAVTTLMRQHDPASPLLVGQLTPADHVTDRKMKSLKEKPAPDTNAAQMNLFDGMGDVG